MNYETKFKLGDLVLSKLVEKDKNYKVMGEVTSILITKTGITCKVEAMGRYSECNETDLVLIKE